ncbi:MAG: substrate-binding domain-containing protein, partial [Microvirga sp.]
RNARPIGCTQVTEMLSTPGVTVAGALPAGFELATIYTAAVAADAAEPVLAHRLAALLTGEAARQARTRAGFS